jgi:hypothetical protein
MTCQSATQPAVKTRLIGSASHGGRNKSPPTPDLAKLVKQLYWLVVDQPFWKIWKSVGIMTFPTEWNNKKCSTPTTSIEIHEIVADILYLQVVQTNQLMGVNHAATVALTIGARCGSFWSYGARIGHGHWIKKNLSMPGIMWDACASQ